MTSITNHDSGSDFWETASEGHSEASDDDDVAYADRELLPIPSHVAPRPGDKLCDVCEKLKLSPRRFVVLPGDKEWNKRNKPDKLSMPLGKVLDMKKKTGCPLCRLVLRSLGDPNQVPTEVDGESVVVVMSWNTNGRHPDPNAPWNHIPEVRILRPYVQTESGQYVDGLNLFPEITLLANDSPTDSISYFIRPIRPNMIDFSLVRKWLGYCQAHHGKKCWRNLTLKELNRSHPSKEVPGFRCIDVEQNCLVRLPQGSRYATLSYVWGQGRKFMTVKANLRSLERPQALVSPEYRDKIPATIMDSIQVMKEIGMRYLWVDSLCIVQDEFETKAAAIKAMDMVYSAADLVIMAAGSEHADAGIAGVYPGTRGTTQLVEEIAPGFRLAARSRYQDALQKVPYSTRAWTFQEFHFAPRTLIFINGGAVFRCRNNDAWEEHVFEPENEVSGEGQALMSLERDDIGRFEGLMQEYSSRVLSFQADVYNAFAGVSRQIMCQLDTDICHGLPTTYFDWFLLWRPLSLQSRRLSEATGRPVGPSWSWSGWVGCSWSHMWDWYNRSIERIDKGIPRRSWIVWYQRQAHDTTECERLVRFNDDKGVAVEPTFNVDRRNFYGHRFQKGRFGSINCSRREPTKVNLTNANPPNYAPDIVSHHSGSGLLQFWTLSVILRIAEPTSEDTYKGPTDKRKRFGIFGSSGRELGTIRVQPAWLDEHPVPEEREFILLCEARDERAESHDSIDEEPGWRYMVMMLEWRDGKGGREAMGSIPSTYAERVAVGSIGKEDWTESLGPGPVWKEVILG
ncbi:heterokaryon incompatibility protein-domain-containing protein [Apiosordaria backusii]|uniref:Heterokaryon incompatibility protein-domain-containing protein n=1 Tax=Apiosordaria backusii TaxID=314023 RepID=A0AA40EGX0_9PEZI|nr:heterokaryon incompatibility protein-domain-containing protein [Apiosordaria backusii]